MAGFCLFLQLAAVSGAHAQNVRTIFFVRHADKASEDTDAPLNDAGRRRAECLANTLADAHIGQIFTSELQRTQRTAAPLAEKLHIKPEAIPIARPDLLIKAIRKGKAENTLVVWHDATLTQILRALGAPEVPPVAHTEYDRFFILTLAAGKANSQPRLTTLRYCDGP
jgi:phosphohistidine phosphatase SixA